MFIICRCLLLVLLDLLIVCVGFWLELFVFVFADWFVLVWAAIVCVG